MPTRVLPPKQLSTTTSAKTVASSTRKPTATVRTSSSSAEPSTGNVSSRRAIPASSSSGVGSRSSRSTAAASTVTATVKASVIRSAASSKPATSSARVKAQPLAKAKETLSNQTITNLPPSEDEIIAALKSVKECTSILPVHFSHLLGTTLEELGLHPRCSNTKLELPSYGASSKLPEARATYFAKLVVNTALSSTSDLTGSGWKASTSLPPQQAGPSSTKSVISRSANSRTRTVKPSASLNADLTKPAAANDASQASVLALVDCFRVAARFLISNSNCPQKASTSKGKELEVENVVLRFVGKLVSLNLIAVAQEELSYLRRTVDRDFEPRVLSETFDQDDCINIPLGPTRGGDWSDAERCFMLELQTHAVACRTSTLAFDGIPALVGWLNAKGNPLEWQWMVRQTCTDYRLADRAAYAIERSVSKCLQAFGSPTGINVFPLRSCGLRLLLEVNEIDPSAFWDRAARTGTGCIRSEIESDRDVKGAFIEVQNLFETLVNRARQISTSKAQGDGYNKFCDNWLSLARKVGSTKSVDLAAKAMENLTQIDHEPSLGTDVIDLSNRTLDLSDVHLAKFAATWTKAVMTLDDLLQEGTDFQEFSNILNESADSIQSVNMWPSKNSEASQAKMYRTLEQIRRRALKFLDQSKALSQQNSRPCTPGKDSDETGHDAPCLSLVYQLLLATLYLLESALGHLPAAECSEQKQPGHMPSQEIVLSDLIQSYRLLASNRFDLHSRGKQAECHGYLERCSRLLLQGSLKTFPTNTLSEKLYLISTSYYHIGGRLYAAKKYIEAVPFLTPACELGRQSLQHYREWKMIRSQDQDPQDDILSEWNTSDAQAERQAEALVKQWEHLAISCRLSHSNDDAATAYKSAVASISSNTLSNLGQASSKTGLETLFNSKEWASLAHLLKSVVEFLVLELHQDQDQCHARLSLVSWLNERETHPEAIGAMLEYSASTLDKKLHYKNAVSSSRYFLTVAHDIYARACLPIRQGRSLLKKIELQLLCGSSSPEQLPELDQATQRCFGNAQALGGDNKLASLLPQYRAMLGLTLSISHQHYSSTKKLDHIINTVQDACRYLSGMLNSNKAAADNVFVGDASVKTRSRPVDNKKLPNATKKAVTTKRVLKSSTAPAQFKAIPVTPPSKSSNVLMDIGKLVHSGSSARATMQVQADMDEIFDGPLHLCTLLETVHEALASFGLTACSIDVTKVLRLISSQCLPPAVGSEIYFRASASLSILYMSLGKCSRSASTLQSVLGRLQESVIESGIFISSDTRFRCLMASACHSAHTGEIAKSIQDFEEALLVAGNDSIPRNSAGLRQCLEKCNALEQKALAFEVASVIHCARGDLVGALESALRTIKLGARVSGLLSRLANISTEQDPSLGNTKSTSDPFLQPSSDDQMISSHPTQVRGANPSVKRCSPRFSSYSLASTFWRVSRLMIHAYLHLSQLHSIGGAGVDAEAFASEGVEFSSTLSLALPLAQALIQRGEIRLQLSQRQAGQEDLSQSLELLEETWIPEVVSLTCIQGDCLAKIQQLPEALKSYAAGEATLRNLSTSFTELEALLSSPRSATGRKLVKASNRSSILRKSGITMETLLPEIHGRLLRRQAWILHLLGRVEEGEQLMEKALNVNLDGAASTDFKVDHHLLQGRLALQKAVEQLKSDQFLSLLPEAAISVPMLPSANSKAANLASLTSAATLKNALNLLVPADLAFREALSSGASCAHALLVREAFGSLSQVHTIQATLGKGNKSASMKATSLLDSALSVSIQRRLLHTIGKKIRNTNVIENPDAWPRLTEIEANSDDDISLALNEKFSRLGLGQEAVLPAVHGSEPINNLPSFWNRVRERHATSLTHVSKDMADSLLPGDWTVISISAIMEQNTLLITRQTGGAGPDECLANEPVIYSLPMDRQSRREGEEEEEELTIRAAQEKLEEIVRRSNDGIHGAKDVEGMEARKQWWTVRRTLDKELEELLSCMQNTWLGGFKGVFAEPLSNDQARSTLRNRFEKIIKRACFPSASSSKKPSKVKLDDSVFECFAGLPASTTEEDFEDFLHYVMDALQFSGLQVAVDEVDLDEVCIDLRTALDEFRSKQAKAAESNDSSKDVDHHLFLILDKETAVFPWESMPILRGRAVSRIPSMAFLQDRIDLAKVYHCLPGQGNRLLGKGKKTSIPVDHADEHGAAWKTALRKGKLFNLSKKRTFYLLNPGGDLPRSQERFEPWLKSRHTQGWTGIVGREPIVDELPNALTSSDLVLYFGHGGAEQFIRQTRVRELERCAVTMLWGCSSALLRDHGEYDRSGTPLNYMCAGSPAMVGNLWDITDRELDSVCEGVMIKLGLMTSEERETVKKEGKTQQHTRPSRGFKEMSIVRAVAESRDECKLSFLTGAACVVYGVPVYWANDED